jgi:hypothetical protein
MHGSYDIQVLELGYVAERLGYRSCQLVIVQQTIQGTLVCQHTAIQLPAL